MIGLTTNADEVIAATQQWLEKAVIGLGLCPFAASVHLSNRIRYCVSEQQATPGLLAELSRELQHLQDADPLCCETTLLIHPLVLNNFQDYNAFLDEADAALTALRLDGELQIASFHPAYQFADTAADDIENYSNRSPFPMLHLLREASVTKAIAGFPGVDRIGSNNIATLRRLGHLGWQALGLH